MYKIILKPEHSRIYGVLVEESERNILVSFRFCLSEYFNFSNIVNDESSLLLNTKHDDFGELCQYILTNNIKDIVVDVDKYAFKQYKETSKNRLGVYSGYSGGVTAMAVINGNMNSISAGGYSFFGDHNNSMNAPLTINPDGTLSI